MIILKDNPQRLIAMFMLEGQLERHTKFLCVLSLSDIKHISTYEYKIFLF